MLELKIDLKKGIIWDLSFMYLIGKSLSISELFSLILQEEKFEDDPLPVHIHADPR